MIMLMVLDKIRALYLCDDIGDKEVSQGVSCPSPGQAGVVQG